MPVQSKSGVAAAAGNPHAFPTRQSSPPTETSAHRWYPSTEQLKDPRDVAAAFKQLLDQHYALQDAHAALQAKMAAPSAAAPAGPPPGSGPTDSQLLGLHVAPIDTQSLADGATLKFVKASGNFQFS